MNRNVVFGALLALAVVGTVVVVTGGRKPAATAAPAPVQQAPIPSLEGVQSEPGKQPTPAPKPAETSPASHPS
jgi:hypothetical protein